MAAARTAAAKAAATLAKLTEKFNVEDHKTNPKGYTYIAIDKVISRFNEVCGEKWDLEIRDVQAGIAPGMTYSRQQKPAGYAYVTVAITAELEGRMTTRSGVGGAYGAFENLDDIVKTALAEAIKKAGNEFGVGLYLWEEEERALIEAAQAAGMTGQVVAAPAATTSAVPTAEPAAPAAEAVSEDELTELKNKVADIAVASGVQRTGPAIAAHFGIVVEALQNPETLRAIIANYTASAVPVA